MHPRIYCAPVKPAEPSPDAAAPQGPPSEPQTPESEGPRSNKGMTFGEVLKQDARQAPAALWDGTKKSFAAPKNLAILAVAFGADLAVRYNIDESVRDYTAHHHTSLHETGDFGTVIGNPFLHFGVACAWYGVAVQRQDDRQHELAKTLIEALAINDAVTQMLQVSAYDEAPNGQKFGWPSGHTSSSICFASVIHEFYGWKAALPLYALAGYSAASRIEDREHDVSDLVFGAALGWVVGHSIAGGEPPQVAGFYVMPYVDPGSSGLMLMKSW